MLVLEGLVCLHRTIQFKLLQLTGRGIDLGYCDIEWFALETNRDHFLISVRRVYSLQGIRRKYLHLALFLSRRKNGDVTGAISHFFKVELLQRAAK